MSRVPLDPATPRERVLRRSNEIVSNPVFRVASSSMRARSIHNVSSSPNVRVDVHDMTHSCEEVPIVDQKETGTCWIQAGTAFLSTLALKRKIKVRLSVPFLAFFDKLEKAYVFLTAMLRETDERRIWHWTHDGPIQDGGTWGMFWHLVRTYGCVLHESMVPTFSSTHSHQINLYLNRYLRSVVPALKEGRVTLAEVMDHVHDALLRTYSFPPSVVTLKEDAHGIEKTTDPEGLAALLIHAECTAHVALTHAPDRPLGAYCGFYTNDVSNPQQDYFVCVEMETLIAACIAQLQTKTPVWFTSDLHHFSSRRGIADVELYNVRDVLNLPIDEDKPTRMGNHNTAPVHAMLLTGVRTEAGQPTHWRIQNSWGKKQCTGAGFVTVTHAWFLEYVFQAVVDPQHVPSRALLASEAPKPIEPWDIFATVAA